MASLKTQAHGHKPDALYGKEVYTTGEAAEVCKVSQQTIIRCFDAGRLQGFRVPGSRFRRIPREALIQFMKNNGIPTDGFDTGKKQVLVVDDDPHIMDLYVDLLTSDPRLEVHTAATGYEAGSLAQLIKPDLIVLDFMLPDINGNVVVQSVRADPSLAHTRIVLVSGVVKQSEIDSLLRDGADDFIKKPFDIEVFQRRVTQLLEL